jgi:hypothetical protein
MAYWSRNQTDKSYIILKTAVYRYLNNKHKGKVYDLHIMVIVTDIKTKERYKILND